MTAALAKIEGGAAPAPMAEPSHLATANDLLLDAQAWGSIMRVADMMAAAKVTIPEHLRGKPADCMAVATQAALWQMNPFAVAQKTHLTPGGQLGYDGQLVNAVVTTRAPIKARPDYEFLGDWSKILGKIEEREGKSGGKYYVAKWDKSAEAGLGVIVRCTLRGEDKPREITVMLSQAWPRFSTQWATDPQQQICYLAIRKWARRITPDVILGVYTGEELEAAEAGTPPEPKNMGPAPVVRPEPPAQLLADAKAAASRGLADYQRFWKAIGKDGRAALADHHEKCKSDAEAVDKNRTVENEPHAAAPAPATAAPAPTPAAKPDPETGEVAPPATAAAAGEHDDFIAAMEAAETTTGDAK